MLSEEGGLLVERAFTGESRGEDWKKLSIDVKSSDLVFCLSAVTNPVAKSLDIIARRDADNMTAATHNPCTIFRGITQSEIKQLLIVNFSVRVNYESEVLQVNPSIAFSLKRCVIQLLSANGYLDRECVFITVHSLIFG